MVGYYDRTCEKQQTQPSLDRVSYSKILFYLIKLVLYFRQVYLFIYTKLKEF